MQSLLWRPALSGAGITVLSLFGGLALGVLAGNLVFQLLPGHSIMNPDPIHILLSALPAISGFLAGSALWGIWMGRLANSHETKQMALAGMLGFAPITLVMGISLQVLEPIAVEKLGALFPIHRLFTLFFAPTAFLIAGMSAFAIGKGLHDALLARRLFWQVGLAAAIAFLIVNVVMELSGWVVGAPNAAARATMLTVLFCGNLGAALVGGAMMGVILARSNAAVRTPTAPAAI